MTQSPEHETIVNLLRSSRTVAVVGLSDDPDRPSHEVAAFLQEHGYHIIPVNPRITEALGVRSYPDLLAISEPVDIVNIFRRSDAVPPIVDQAIQLGAKAVWMQKGVINPAAAEKASTAGLQVVMDRCIMVELSRLFRDGTLSPPTASSIS